jgi:hypothetical protein
MALQIRQKLGCSTGSSSHAQPGTPSPVSFPAGTTAFVTPATSFADPGPAPAAAVVPVVDEAPGASPVAAVRAASDPGEGRSLRPFVLALAALLAVVLWRAGSLRAAEPGGCAPIRGVRASRSTGGERGVPTCRS